MLQNINTKSYWEQRFSSQSWEEKNGREQSAEFAHDQIRHFGIKQNFAGSILDFGCALGDAFPIYKKAFPNANLIGIDISQKAIELCKAHFGTIATFIQGDFKSVPDVDVIIASNVFEHLSNHIEIATYLQSKCNDLYITVPYKENPLFVEHVNTYDENSFSMLRPYSWKTFASKGWFSEYGMELWYQINFKNLFRMILGRQLRQRRKQIMFHFSKTLSR